MINKSSIHLWIFNHPFHGISDQIDYFLLVMQQHGYKVTVGRRPQNESLNVVIENFSEKSSKTLINYCKENNKRVAIIMTEHIDFYQNKIYIHGNNLWEHNDYMHPAIQVTRIRYLFDCINYIRCLFTLGDLPKLENFETMLPGITIYRLPFPTLKSSDIFGSRETNKINIDALFTGVLTKYREKFIKSLRGRTNVYCPGKFVSRKSRNNLILSSKVVLNIPQRPQWNWLSLMRVISALRCGRITVSLGTNDLSEISKCCHQLSINQKDWIEKLRFFIDNYSSEFQTDLYNYNKMAHDYQEEHIFPNGLFDYWSILEL